MTKASLGSETRFGCDDARTVARHHRCAGRLGIPAQSSGHQQRRLCTYGKSHGRPLASESTSVAFLMSAPLPAHEAPYRADAPLRGIASVQSLGDGADRSASSDVSGRM